MLFHRHSRQRCRPAAAGLDSLQCTPHGHPPQAGSGVRTCRGESAAPRCAGRWNGPARQTPPAALLVRGRGARRGCREPVERRLRLPHFARAHFCQAKLRASQAHASRIASTPVTHTHLGQCPAPALRAVSARAPGARHPLASPPPAGRACTWLPEWCQPAAAARRAASGCGCPAAAGPAGPGGARVGLQSREQGTRLSSVACRQPRPAEGK